MDLDARVRIAHRTRADLFVSIHADSASNPAASGYHTIYPPDKWGAQSHWNATIRGLRFAQESDLDPKQVGSSSTLTERAEAALFEALMEEYALRSRELAESIQHGISRQVRSRNRNARADVRELRVLLHARCPAVLVETGFLSNRAEEKRLGDGSYRDRIAEGITRGILAYVKAHQ